MKRMILTKKMRREKEVIAMEKATEVKITEVKKKIRTKSKT